MRFNEFLVEETIKPENKRKRKLNCESYGLDTSISKESLMQITSTLSKGSTPYLMPKKQKNCDSNRYIKADFFTVLITRIMAFVPPGLRVFGLPPGSNEENLFTLKPLLVYAAVYPCIVYNTWKIKLLQVT